MFTFIWILSSLISSSECLNFASIRIAQTSSRYSSTLTSPSSSLSSLLTTLVSNIHNQSQRDHHHHQRQKQQLQSLYYRQHQHDDENYDINHRSEIIRKEWNINSVQYYSKVLREKKEKETQEQRYDNDQKQEQDRISSRFSSSSIRNRNVVAPITRSNNHQQQHDHDINTNDNHYSILAKKHYFALRKIKDGKPHHAEHIYRRIINELLHGEKENDDEHHHCDHSRLAVTTLLLALHLQRNNKCPKKVRSVFLHFFRTVTASSSHHHHSISGYDNNNSSDGHNDDDNNIECACSAKVLQAFALFEMKQGYGLKSLHLVQTAIKFDPSLRPILNWKQFRDAIQKQDERKKVNQEN